MKKSLKNMKHLKKFNENVSYNNEDIEELFLDLTDSGATLEITDKYLNSKNEVVNVTPYVKNPTKIRHCKVVHLILKENKKGLDLQVKGMYTKTMTDIEDLEVILSKIKRFYTMMDDTEPNFLISSDYMGTNIYFVIKGDYLTEEHNKSEKVDEYLKKLKDIIRMGGNYRIRIDRNLLEMRGEYAESKRLVLMRVENGTYNEDHELYTRREDIRKMVEWLRDLRNDGLDVYISGGDRQMIVKIKL